MFDMIVVVVITTVDYLHTEYRVREEFK